MNPWHIFLVRPLQGMAASRTTFLLALSILLACAPGERAGSQSAGVMRKLPGGMCETCPYALVGLPESIDAIDTSRGWWEDGVKLQLRGRVFEPDGRTPASDILLYYYHTDAAGYYSPGQGDHPEALRHGHLRGWVRSDADGQFTICTIRPASYPDTRFEAHIHVIVKEPDLDLPYWIDDWVFDNDPLLTPEIRRRKENRGGHGVLTLRREGNIEVAEPVVILGKNIPGYPLK